MTTSLDRFSHHINSIEEIMQTLKKSDDVLNGIFSFDLRTPLFMIQGLARLYRNVYPTDKIFEKILKHSKKLEDTIGQLDHNKFLFEYYQKKTKSQWLLDHYEENIESAKALLMSYINDKKWWKGKRLSKWREELSAVQWHSQEDELPLIVSSYKAERDKCLEFIDECPIPLDDMEFQVHELRRKLRWLSIYAQASQGLFILRKNTKRSEALKGFHLKGIVESPFTSLQKDTSLTKHIALSHGDFIALSWIIKKLGDIKDKGLITYDLNHFLHIIKADTKLKSQIKREFAEEYKSFENLLLSADKVLKTFKQKDILNQLI